MLRLIEDFDLHRFRCIFVVADSDHTSRPQACELLKTHRSVQVRYIHALCVSMYIYQDVLTYLCVYASV